MSVQPKTLVTERRLRTPLGDEITTKRFYTEGRCVREDIVIDSPIELVDGKSWPQRVSA